MGKPFQGICQGNGTDLVTWIAVSIILVLMLYKHNHILRLWMVLSMLIIAFVGFLFINDMDLITFALSPDDSPTQVTIWMRNAILTWNGGLNVMNRALKPSKCKWCLIAF
jgi:multisubunit Na+/H+ antiporter MnhB subunit